MNPYQHPYEESNSGYVGMQGAPTSFGYSPYGTPPMSGQQMPPTSPYPMTPNNYNHNPFPTTPKMDQNYSIDARLDRLEREIVEINRRLNTITRQVKRIENFLNIRNDA